MEHNDRTYPSKHPLQVPQILLGSIQSHLKHKTMFCPKIPEAVAEATRLWSGYPALDTLRSILLTRLRPAGVN